MEDVVEVERRRAAACCQGGQQVPNLLAQYVCQLAETAASSSPARRSASCRCCACPDSRLVFHAKYRCYRTNAVSADRYAD